MTLKEIAAELEVSPSIVSRVINGYTRNFSISDELRERILRKVEDSGYSPNPVFRAMRQHKNRQLSFINRDIFMLRNGGIIADAIIGMQKVLDAKEYQLNYTYIAGDTDAPCVLPFWKVSGLFLPDIVRKEHLKPVEDAQIPYVVVNGIPGETGVAVQSDEIDGMNQLLDHLTALGHRRIAYFNYEPCVRHYSMIERESAYCRYLKTHDLPEIDGFQSSHKNVPELLQLALEQKATAIICFNEAIAFQVLREAWKDGIRVPAQLSVACFNNTQETALFIPSLTCMAVPGLEMGELAAELMVKRLAGDELGSERIWRCRESLIVRESTASVN